MYAIRSYYDGVLHRLVLGQPVRDLPVRRITSYNVCYTKLLRVDGEGGVRGTYSIDSAYGTDEIFDTATEFERVAYAFYSALIPKVSKNIRWLVEELAEEELRNNFV